MRRFISFAGITMIPSLFLVATLGTTSPAAAETGMALLRATQSDASPGQDALNSACTTCHDLTAVQPGIYTGAEWSDTINRMIGYGASVSDAQFDAMLAYLATDAPAAEGGGDASVGAEAAQALLNTSCTTCHDLAGVEPGIYTADQWTETINRMIGYGATVSEEEIATIARYLGTDTNTGSDQADPEAAAALLNSACSTCHDLEGYGILPESRTGAEWTEVITRMMGYGAMLTDDEANMLLIYLATDW